MAKKKFDDFGAEVAPSEKPQRGRGQHGAHVENIRKERAKKRRISHGIVLSCDVKKVFKDMPTPEKTNGAELRVVVWSTATKAVFEKRKYWIRPNGGHLNRQLTGLDVEDIRFIAEHADEIIAELDKASAGIKIVKPEVAEKLAVEQNANS